MILAEWKKLLHNRSFLLFFGVLLLAGILNPMVCAYNASSSDAAELQAQQAAGYAEYLESICTREEAVRNSILYKGNDYALRLARMTAAEYADLNGLTLPQADPVGVQLALGNWADDAVSCGVVCLAAVFLFLQERQEGMMPLLFSTRHGRRTTYRAKLLLIGILGTLCGVFFAVVRIGVAGELGNLTRPIQSIPEFYASPYRISVGTMMVLSTVQRILASLVVGICMSLLCIVLDRGLALGLAAIITAVQILCWQTINQASWLQPLKYLSIPALFSDETLLGNAVFVNFFGIPVNYCVIYGVLIVGCGLLLTAVGSCCYVRSVRAISIPDMHKPTKQKREIQSLFCLEMRKLLVYQKGAILLLLLMLLQPGFYSSFWSGITEEELRYLEQMRSIEGQFQEETHKALQSELESLQNEWIVAEDILVSQELMKRINTVNRALSVSNYLVERTEPVCYVYETGYEAMFGAYRIGLRYQPALIALVLCLLLPSLFTVDRETGIEGLIQTTSGAGAAKTKRWAIAMLLSALVFFICWVPEMLFIFRSFDLPVPDAPAVSLQMLGWLPGWIPLWLAVSGLWLLRLAEAIATGAVVCFASEKSGKYFSAVFLSGVLVATMEIILNIATWR